MDDLSEGRGQGNPYTSPYATIQSPQPNMDAVFRLLLQQSQQRMAADLVDLRAVIHTMDDEQC